jgi:iron complex outermembrane receptor protein
MFVLRNHSAILLMLSLVASPLTVRGELPAEASSEDIRSLANLSLEELLDIEVSAISRFSQRVRNTSALVTVVKREEIRNFGYETFADLAAALPGLQSTYDRRYTNLSLGGISPAKDFNGRFLLLVDGQRVNDALYDSFGLGTDFPIDIASIERVEFLRGPSAATYGNNAVFGVFNVMTRDVHAADAQLSLGAGSRGRQHVRASLAHRAANGISVQGSASHQRRDGYDSSAMGELPKFSGGDGEHSNRFQVSIRGESVALRAYHSSRDKRVPLPYFGTAFGDERNRISDTQGAVSVSGELQPSASEAVQGRIYYSYYDFQAVYPTPADSNLVTLNIDDTSSKSYGAEAQLRSSRWKRHQVVIGVNAQRDYRLTQRNFDLDPPEVYIDRDSERTRYGFNVQDDWQVAPQVAINVGLRFDALDGVQSAVSPRLGAVWLLPHGQSVKLQYGEAFRAPNEFEQFGLLVGNDGLQAERVRSADLVWEGFPNPALRVQAGLHYSTLTDIIEDAPLAGDGSQFQNRGRTDSLALELATEYRWARQVGFRLHTTLQRARDDAGEQPLNSARWLFKGQYWCPLPKKLGTLGLEAHAVSSRQSVFGTVPSYSRLNLAVSEVPIPMFPRITAQVRVKNLFDTRALNPNTELQDVGVDSTELEGRSFWLRLEAAL